MFAFEYMMTLSSFVIALGIGTVLLSVATMLHRREQVKLALAPMLWMAMIFLEQINVWLALYRLHDQTHWSIVYITFLVIAPTLLFLQAALIVPDSGGSLDLAEHHRRNFRFYTGLAICSNALTLAMMMWMTFVDPPDGGFVVRPQNFALFGVRLALAVVATIWATRWVQISAAALMLASSIAVFIIGGASLSGGG